VKGVTETLSKRRHSKRETSGSRLPRLVEEGFVGRKRKIRAAESQRKLK
jgi:hypothetical protein